MIVSGARRRFGKQRLCYHRSAFVKLTSDQPISAACAEAVKQAANRCLQLPLQDARIEAGAQRIVQLVQAVLDNRTLIPRHELYRIARDLWEQVRHQSGVAPEVSFEFRSIITTCLQKIRALAEPPDLHEPLLRMQYGEKPVMQSFVRAPLPLAPLTGSLVPWLTSIHSPVDRGGYARTHARLQGGEN